MTKFLAGAIAASVVLAAPASAATFTFNFGTGTGATWGTNSSNNFGNVRSWTVASGGETLTLRATGWAFDSNGRAVAGNLGRWDNGLGVINRTDGGSNYHATDNIGALDFILFEFSKVVTLGAVTTVAYSVDGTGRRDGDMGVLAADLGSQAFGNIGSSALTAYSSLIQDGMVRIGGNGGTQVRNLTQMNLSGNTVIIGAAAMGDNIGDGFKLRALAVTTPAAAVPEPATWAMMISGFGMIGAGIRRRRTADRLAAA